MVTAILLSSLALAAAPTAEYAAPPQNPVVKVWLNKKGNVNQGDRVRVYTRAEADGYLLVLHAEPDGRIRVLFPLDPFHDSFLRGGQDYELRGRGDREAFRVYETGGLGTVFAALSRNPYQFGEFVRGDHWDYRILDQWRLTEDLDPETELLALARAMAGEVGFEYDLVHYPVGSQATTYYGGGSTYFSAGFGYYPSSYWGISFGWGYPSYWGSYWYDPWYRWGYYPYYYRYRPYYWGGYYPYYYYPYHYAYYPYYGGGSYYPGGGYWSGYPRSPSGTTYRGRYAWKDNGRYDLSRGGVTTRRRTSPSGSRGLYSDLGSRYASERGGRRAAPGVVNTAGRRVSPTADRATGRRVSPATGNTAGRRSVATPADAGRRVPTGQPQAETGRRVQPSGWGITDGRRTVTPSARPTRTETPSAGNIGRRTVTPTHRNPGTAQPNDVTSRRTVPTRGATPQREASPRREVTPQRRAEPTSTRITPNRTGTSARRQTTTRSVQPNRSSKPSTAPARRSTPSLERRTSPKRTPSARPSTPSRSAPRPSVNRRPSTPSRPQVSRPSAPARAPARAAPRSAPRPQVSRPSAPRSAPRPSAPSRPSSGRRKR